MTDAYNLADNAWVGVLDATGTHDASLRELLTNLPTIRQIATGNPLADAAITQLLLAITLDSQAHQADNPTERQHRYDTWLDEHHHQLNLFDPTYPFAQYAPQKDLDNPPQINTLFYNFDTADVAFSSYDSLTNPTSNATLTPAQAAQLLLVRQHFSVGGIQSRAARTISGTSSALAALDGNHPIILPRTGTLAEDLQLMAQAATDSDAPLGTLHLGLDSDAPLGTVLDKPGILDVLTYPSRAMCLFANPDGLVDRAHYAEGMRLKAEQLTPELWPATTWTVGKKGPEPRKAHLSRPAWQQLLDAYSLDDTPGLLGHLPAGTRLTLTTMSAYTSRVDGIYHQHATTPTISTEEVKELSRLVSEVRKAVSKDNYITARALKEGSITATNIGDTLTDTMRPEVTANLGRIVTSRMAGMVTAEQADRQAQRLVAAARDHATSFTTAHPAGTANRLAQANRYPWKGTLK